MHSAQGGGSTSGDWIPGISAPPNGASSLRALSASRVQTAASVRPGMPDSWRSSLRATGSPIAPNPASPTFILQNCRKSGAARHFPEITLLCATGLNLLQHKCQNYYETVKTELRLRVFSMPQISCARFFGRNVSTGAWSPTTYT